MPDRPGRQQLSGYVMRDYDRAIVALRRAWIAQGVSQQELAERVGGPRSRIATTLSGEHEALGSRLFALADALGYDLALIPREDPSRAEAHCEGCGGPCRDESDWEEPDA